MNRAQRRARARGRNRPTTRAEQQMLDHIGRKYACPDCGAEAEPVQRAGWQDWQVAHAPGCTEATA